MEEMAFWAGLWWKHNGLADLLTQMCEQGHDIRLCRLGDYFEMQLQLKDTNRVVLARHANMWTCVCMACEQAAKPAGKETQ